jgi:hypothetical protein
MDNPLVAVHGYMLAFAIIGSWATIMFWSLALRFTKYEETPTFWRAVSVAQVLLGVQLLLGMVLLTRYALAAQFGIGSGGLPGDGSAWDVTWHMLYGLIFPFVVLFVAHKGAREGRFHPHSAFAVVGLVNFGLTARAWQVGVSFFG